MNSLDSAKDKIASGGRLERDEILALYEANDLLYLAESARRVKEAKTGKKVFYTVNRHINLTNVCKANWVILTVPVAQVALSFRASDIDGTIHHENILHDAGATSPRSLAEDEIIRIIREAGRVPVAMGGNA